MIISLVAGIFIVIGGIGVVVYLISQGKRGLAKAEKLYHSKKYDEALVLLHTVIEEDPSSIDALWYLGNIYEIQKKYSDALKYYNSILSNQTFSELFSEIDLHKHLARVYLKIKDIPNAEKAVEIMIKNNPQDPAGHLKLGELAISRGDHSKALSAFRNALTVKPKNLEALKALGMCYYDMRRFENVCETFKEYIIEAGSNTPVEIYYYNAMAAKELGRFQAALQNFEKCKDDKKRGAESILEIAFAHQALGNAKAAVEAFEEAVNLQIKDRKMRCEALYQLADLKAKGGELKKACDLWERIYNIDPQYKDVAAKVSSFGSIKDSDEMLELMSLPKKEFAKKMESVLESQKYIINKQMEAEEGKLRYITTFREKGDSYEVLVEILKSSNPVGELNIRECARLVQENRTHKGLFICTSSFTAGAHKATETYPVDLMSGEELKKVLKKN